MIIIPTQRVKTGQHIIHEGISFVVIGEFITGDEAKASGLEYFMKTERGLLGLMPEPIFIPQEEPTPNTPAEEVIVNFQRALRALTEFNKEVKDDFR